MYNKIEKIMKKCLKEKITITSATIVGFLITGSVVLAANENYVHEITAGEEVIKENLTNKDQPGKHGILNIWENNISSADSVKVTNMAEIRQVGTERAIAAVNIANGADFINNGTIVVDKNGALSGTAIEKGFGSLRENMNISSNVENNGSITMENSRVAMGIKAIGYKNQNGIVGKDNVKISNSGDINISNLSSKEITFLEKAAWNVLNKFKITAGEGSIGVGITGGDFIDIENSGTIKIDNQTPMTVTGTVDGVEKVVTLGGVGIAAINSGEKVGEKVDVINTESGTIELTGNNSIGIAAVKDVNVKNSGTINVSGVESVGVFLLEGATLENSGIIKANGTKSYAILSSGEIEDTVNLKAGSHIEGVIDLGAGNDSINILGVGSGNKAEKLEVTSVENIKIENSNIELYGKVEAVEKESSIELKNSLGDNKFVNYGDLIAKGAATVKVVSTDSSIGNNNKVEIINKGNIISDRYGIYNNAYETAYNPVEIINDGNITINGFESSSSEGNPHLYSNGIYSATRPNAKTVAYVENNGKIEVRLNETDQKTVLDILKSNPEKIYDNIAGIRLHGVSSGVNNGEIINNAHTGAGIILSGENHEGLEGRDRTFVNSESGKISITGDYAKGVHARSSILNGYPVINSIAKNNGEIEITGKNSIGMFADNSTIVNNGVIKLNLFQADGKTLADNKAMYGIGNSIVENNSSIYLNDVTVKGITSEELENLTKYVNNNLISGDESAKVTNNGIIRNSKGEIIFAAGGGITEVIPDLGITENGDYDLTEELVAGVIDKETPITTDRTLAFGGDKLDLNINADTNFDKQKHLVSLDSNENVLITGNLIGADKGILVQNSNLVMENAKIEVNVNNKNNIALDFDNNSTGKLVETFVTGNININNTSEVILENSTVTGNITLDKNSALAMDTVSTEKFNGVISGHNNGSKVILGNGNTAEGKNITKFNGTIENIDSVETNGILVMEEKSNFINSSVKVGDENLLVIRVGKGENDYALSDNVGSINLSENGHMMIETGRVDIQNGDIIQLGTTIVGSSSNIHASEFIYDISLVGSDSEVAQINLGSQLLVTLKNAEELGLDSSVSEAYDSLASTGRLSGLVSVGTGKDVNELNSLLNQNVDGNAYALGDKVSKDSIKSWNDTVKRNINFLNPGEFKVSGLSMGAFEDANTNVDYDFSGTGLMVLGEYGYDSKTTLGFSLGGGAVSGELNSKNKVNGDSFYISAFGKKAINEILLTANIGYQFNKLKGKRAIGNAYESYNFSEKFDTNGFNIDLEGRYIYTLNNGFTLEPHLGVNIISIKQDSISENVADGALAMEIDSFSNTTLETKIGVELAKNIVTNAGSKVKLFGDLSYVNNSGDVDKNLTGKFVGATSDFDVKPVEIGKNKGELALGGKVELTSGVFTDAKVAYSFGDNDYTKVTVGLGYIF
ncbi:MAG: autotransporter domain-containing protein [Cetobacterium sp.]|uniref:autotransporter family protein n=1 Tax=Cetobacterium sp. TaxID=2071632 RepID=UPI003EE4A9ED